MHGVKPGWQFLTGRPADIRFIRYRLGFFDPDPIIDGTKATHTARSASATTSRSAGR